MQKKKERDFIFSCKEVCDWDDLRVELENRGVVNFIGITELCAEASKNNIESISARKFLQGISVGAVESDFLINWSEANNTSLQEFRERKELFSDRVLTE